MRMEINEPYRYFKVNPQSDVNLIDCGKIYLEANEQVTFVTPNGKEHDFAAKTWGFYATPSLNKRLVDFGFKTALVRNSLNCYYVMVVDIEKIADFEAYIKEEQAVVIEWLNELGAVFD